MTSLFIIIPEYGESNTLSVMYLFNCYLTIYRLDFLFIVSLPPKHVNK